MNELPLPVLVIVLLVGMLILAFAGASLIAWLRTISGTRISPVEIDADDGATRISMSDGASARIERDGSAIVAGAEQRSPAGKGEPLKMPRHWRRFAALACVAAIVIYWAGRPWTMTQCMMDASKSATQAGVRVAMMACNEMFGGR